MDTVVTFEEHLDALYEFTKPPEPEITADIIITGVDSDDAIVLTLEQTLGLIQDCVELLAETCADYHNRPNILIDHKSANFMVWVETLVPEMKIFAIHAFKSSIVFLPGKSTSAKLKNLIDELTVCDPSLKKLYEFE